ncbi:conserved Plasmodium protein, unknown function [Plasmodium ovale curtisi]|uniref:MerC domain-containing protein n=1 Tax=Plasmodium ovale curtisi TaxID=864141 RepID=A0A1A8VUW4_PLAOA|nr:conserved Plasmodium protein, unknown function [Plasmodium ovale curtisi]
MKKRFTKIYNYVKLNLNKISSIASLICLIDCVLIPIITVVLSLINVVSNSQSDHGHTSEDNHHPEWHEAVEKIALYLMTPIISLTTIYNFSQLRNIPLLLFALIGIALFVLSHAHIDFNSENVNTFFKRYHIPIAIIGAICLVSTNYVAHEMLKAKNLDHCCKNRKETTDVDDNICEHHLIKMNCGDLDYVNDKYRRERDEIYKMGYQQHSEHELVSFL